MRSVMVELVDPLHARVSRQLEKDAGDRATHRVLHAEPAGEDRMRAFEQSPSE
jgi:hypothetical protein